MKDHVSVSDVLDKQTTSPFKALTSNQAFYVFVSVCIIIAVMSQVHHNFLSTGNFYNVTRNFAFIGIMAVGMTAVIITAGIDLSVGSTLGLVMMVSAVALKDWGWSVAATIALGVFTSLVVGGINGILIAYLRLNPFIVTLGMLSIARSITLVWTNAAPVTLRRGSDAAAIFMKIGGGSLLGVANPVWALLVVMIVVALILKLTVWGRYVYAIGGNENAARLTGVPVDVIKVSVYMLSALTAGIAGLLMLGWAGSALSNFGTGYELRVIASSVIGGANLLGGAGSAIGGVIGAALIEIIRNSLLLAGVNTFWQGTFVGLFIIFAVVLEKVRNRGAT